MASYQAVNAVLQAIYEESPVEQQAPSPTMAVPQNEIDDSRASDKVVLAPESSLRNNNASPLSDDVVVERAMGAYRAMEKALRSTREYINLQYQTNPQAKAVMQAEVDDLRRRLNDADTEIGRHRAHSARISQEKKALRIELNDKHQDAVRANRKCLQSEAAWRSADQRIKNMEGTEKSLRSLNSELDKRLADAMDSKKTIEAAFASAQEKLANAEEDRAILRSEAINTKERLASVDQSNQTTEAKYLTTRAELETSKASETTLRSKNMELEAELSDAIECMRTIEASRDEAIVESEINRVNWIEAHSAMTNADSVNKFLEGKMQQQDSDIKAMEQRNARLCEDLDSARSQTEAAQRDLRLRNDEAAVQRYRVSIAPDCHTVAWFNHSIEMTRNENAYDIVCIMASQNETTKTAERETVWMLTSSRDQADRLRREVKALKDAAVESDNATEKHAKHLSEEMADLSIKVDRLRKEKDELKTEAEGHKEAAEDTQMVIKSTSEWIGDLSRHLDDFILKTNQQRKEDRRLEVPTKKALDFAASTKDAPDVKTYLSEQRKDVSQNLTNLIRILQTSEDSASAAEKNGHAAEHGRLEAERNFHRVQRRLEGLEKSSTAEKDRLKSTFEQRIEDLSQNLNDFKAKAQESEELASAAEQSRIAAELDGIKAKVDLDKMRDRVFHLEEASFDEKQRSERFHLREQLRRQDKVCEEERTKATRSEEKAREAAEELEKYRAKAKELQEALTKEKREEASKAAEELESCRAESRALQKALIEEKSEATKRGEEAAKLTEDLQASRSQVQRLEEAAFRNVQNIVTSQRKTQRLQVEVQGLQNAMRRAHAFLTGGEQPDSGSDDGLMVIEETDWIEARQGAKVKPVSKESERQRSFPQAVEETSVNSNTMPPPPTPAKNKSRMASSTSASGTSSKSPRRASSISEPGSPSALRKPQATNTSSKASTPTNKRAASSDASNSFNDPATYTETPRSSRKRNAPPEAIASVDENASEPRRPKRIRRPAPKLRPDDAEIYCKPS